MINEKIAKKTIPDFILNANQSWPTHKSLNWRKSCYHRCKPCILRNKERNKLLFVVIKHLVLINEITFRRNSNIFCAISVQFSCFVCLFSFWPVNLWQSIWNKWSNSENWRELAPQNENRVRECSRIDLNLISKVMPIESTQVNCRCIANMFGAYGTCYFHYRISPGTAAEEHLKDQ